MIALIVGIISAGVSLIGVAVIGFVQIVKAWSDVFW